MANFKQIYGFSEENWIHLTENTVIACTALVLQESVFPLVVFLFITSNFFSLQVSFLVG